MRIRSTKPEFWRSFTIASLDWDSRLVLKGVESYVDDNGVGKDSVPLICADVFPHDLARDLETLARVSRALLKLAEANLIARYTVENEPLLYVRRWKSIQRVDKPNKGRFPRPDGTMEYSESVDETVLAGQSVSTPSDSGHSREPSGDPRDTLANTPETLAPVTEEQRNRGTGDKRRAPAKPDAPKSPEQIATTNAYERVGKAFKYVAVLQIAKWAIHDRGENENTVEDAIVAIYEMGKPITKQLVGQYLDGHLARPGIRPLEGGMSRADQKVQGWLDIGARLTNHDEPNGIA